MSKRASQTIATTIVRGNGMEGLCKVMGDLILRKHSVADVKGAFRLAAKALADQQGRKDLIDVLADLMRTTRNMGQRDKLAETCDRIIKAAQEETSQ
jgi:hypothetical protein